MENFIAVKIIELNNELDEAKRLLHGYCPACAHAYVECGACRRCKWDDRASASGEEDLWTWKGVENGHH